MQTLYSRLTRPFKNIFDWSIVHRSMILIVFLMVVIVQYSLWGLFFCFYPSPFINAQALTHLLYIMWFMGLSALAMVLIAQKYRNYDVVKNVAPYIFAIYFGLALVVMGYYAGLLYAPAGLVLGGAPIVGLILINRHVTYTALGLAVSLILIISIFTALGYVPYAPLFNRQNLNDSSNLLFITLSLGYFSFPHIVATFVLSDISLERWRIRERLIYELSMTDGLTGIRNRYAINGVLNRLAYERQNEPLSVVMIDIDFFKDVNDVYGHLVGDQVLKRAGQVFKDSIRRSDYIGRYGGEEFLVVLQNTDEEEATRIAERCRQAIMDAHIYSDTGVRVTVTASCGVYCSVNNKQTVEELIRLADRNLYIAKNRGRNCVWNDTKSEENTEIRQNIRI